jgi:ribose-phosphate pyrophosphokinase
VTALVFAPGASAGYGAEVARAMGARLGALDERVFGDGEHKDRPLDEVAGRDVFVVSSLYGDAQASANDKLVRLLFLVATLHDLGAARITAVCPYLAYSRKDRRTQPADPVTTRYVAQLLEAAGIDCIVAMDVHNQAAFENAFRCRTVHLDAAGLFVDHYRDALHEDEVAVVSPDAGGMKRAEGFRQRLQRSLGRSVTGAVAEKYRTGTTVTGNALVGKVDGRTAVIVDDLISAGTTLARAAAACRHAGAARVIAAATHGVFAAEANTVLGGSSEVDAIAITDSIIPWRISDPRLRERVSVVSSTGLLAQALTCLHESRALPG